MKFGEFEIEEVDCDEVDDWLQPTKQLIKSRDEIPNINFVFFIIYTSFLLCFDFNIKLSCIQDSCRDYFIMIK